MMVRNSRQEYLMIGVDRGVESYLSTLATKGKNSAYINGLEKRLRYLLERNRETHGQIIWVQDLAVEDGWDYLRSLQKRTTKYEDHPMHDPVEKRLKPHYINGCS
jgi:hypothetical protein